MKIDILVAARAKRLAVGTSGPGLAIDAVSGTMYLSKHFTAEK